MNTRDFSPTLTYIEADNLSRIYAMTGHRLRWPFDTYNYAEFFDEPSTYDDNNIVVLLSAARARSSTVLLRSYAIIFVPRSLELCGFPYHGINFSIEVLR